MEKNIPNDNLEKFLQRALENYEESPSDELWGKIESALPAAAPVATASTMVVLQKWAAGVAAILLIGFSLFQFFHHKAEIARLSDELNCTRMELQDFKEQSSVPVPIQPQAVLPPNENDPVPSGELPRKQANVPQPGSGIPASLPRKAGLAIPGNSSLVGAFSNENLEELASIKHLPLASGVNRSPKPEFSMPVFPVKVMKNRTRWSVGLQSGLAHTESIADYQSEPGPGHQEPVKKVDDREVTRSSQIMAGVSVDYDLGKNWSIGSGMQYRRFDFQLTHDPGLKFGDREHHSHHHNHDFNYYLNTPSGTVYVSLSAEQTDPDEDISNQEELEVEITTEEKMEFLSIPLVLGYRIGRGRLSGQLKAGLMANIGLEHSLKVEDFRFQNQKFKPHENGPINIDSPSLYPVSFDYYLAAGLAYDVSPSWQVSLMPSFSGAVTKKFDALLKDPGDYSLGLAAGLNYRF